MRNSLFQSGIFIFVLLLSASFYAQADVLELTGKEEIIRLKDRHVQILEDPERKFNYPEMRSRDFQKQEGTQGITQSVYWAKLQINNSSKDSLSRLLMVDYPLAEKIILYTGEGNNPIQSGSAVPFKEQAFQSSDILFPILLKPGSNEMYLRLESPVVKFPVSIYASASYFQERKSYFIYYAITGGFILLAIIINLVFYFQTRERLHLYYGAYMITGVFTFLSYIGLAHQYIWTALTSWNQFSFLSLQNLMIALHIPFAADLLNLKKINKRIYRILMAAALVFTANAFLALVLPSWISYHVLSVLCILLLPLGLLAGYYPLRKKYKPAYYYMAACLMFTFSIATSFARHFQEDPEPEGACRSIAFALAVEILIFSIATGLRVKGHFEIQNEESDTQKGEAPEQVLFYETNTFGLTNKERLIVKHLSEGLSDKEISDSLDISVTTVKTHLRSIYQKLEVRNRTEAVNKMFKEENDLIL